MPSSAQISGRSQRALFALIALIFLCVQVIGLTLGCVGVRVVDATRAYTNGESFYSKSQKSAVLSLRRYAQSGDETYFRSFLSFIDVPIGDNVARRELERPGPDYRLVTEGFGRGRNHPNDIPRLIELYTYARNWGPFATAVEDWANAEPKITRLLELGTALHRLFAGGPPSAAARETILDQIDTVDEQLTRLEDSFSSHMREASSIATRLVIEGLVFSSVGLLAIGLAFVWFVGSKSIAINTKLEQSQQELADAKIHADLANRAKSEFLANISHELRTPLNVIIGFAELMKGNILKRSLDPKYSEYAADIYDSGMHLLSVINDLLDLSKIEAGREELSVSEVDMAEVVASTVRLLNDRFRDAGVAVTTLIPPALPRIRADERRMRQVLMNLLSNAAKFTLPGGQIDIAVACTPANGLEITIRDTGIGIAEEDLPEALSPFGQVVGSRNRKSEGTGLGLPLTKGLIELHGGTFALRSRLGEGTTAIVILPRDALAAGQASNAAQPRQ